MISGGMNVAEQGLDEAVHMTHTETHTQALDDHIVAEQGL